MHHSRISKDLHVEELLWQNVGFLGENSDSNSYINVDSPPVVFWENGKPFVSTQEKKRYAFEYKKYTNSVSLWKKNLTRKYDTNQTYLDSMH